MENTFAAQAYDLDDEWGGHAVVLLFCAPPVVPKARVVGMVCMFSVIAYLHLLPPHTHTHSLSLSLSLVYLVSCTASVKLFALIRTLLHL